MGTTLDAAYHSVKVKITGTPDSVKKTVLIKQREARDDTPEFNNTPHRLQVSSKNRHMKTDSDIKNEFQSYLQDSNGPYYYDQSYR